MFPGPISLESSIDSAPTYTLDMGASHHIPLQNPVLAPFTNLRAAEGSSLRHVGSGGCTLEAVGNFSFSPPAFQALPQTSTVQVRNRTTGAAMSLLEKCDARIVYL